MSVTAPALPRNAAAETVGTICALAAATLYGINIISTRIAASEEIYAPALVAWRAGLLLAIIAPIVFVEIKSSGNWPHVERAEWPALVVMAVSTATMGLAYLSAVAFIPTTLAVVILYVYPALVLLAGPLVADEALTARRVVLVALALAGIVLVVGPRLTTLDWRGLVLAALACLAVTAQFLAGARLRKTSPVATMLVVHLVVLPVALGVAAATASWSSPADLMRAPLAVAITIGAYLLAFGLNMAALTRLGAVRVGLLCCAEPVVTAVTAMIVLDERLDAVQAVGAVVVLAAVVATAVGARPRNAS